MRFDPSRTMLAGIPRPTLVQWLSDAQSAYALLMTGGKPVSISYEGKAVSYTPAQGQNLQNWIVLLQSQISGRRERRPLIPYFR
jgi:hypothetical protein